MLHPLRWVAATRVRLLIAINLSAVVMLAFAPTVGSYVRHQSTSPTVDLLLITSWMFVLLVVSIFEAILAGDLLFRHRWRERVILGEEIVDISGDVDADPELLHKRTRTNILGFSLLVVAFALLNGTLVNVVSGRFMDYYQQTGYYRTVMRSDDIALKKTALLDIAQVQKPVLQELVMDIVVPVAAGDDPVMRVEGLYCLSEVARRMSRSVDILNADDAPGTRWEYGTLSTLKKEVAPLARRLFETGHGDEKVAAARLLGSLRDVEAVPLLARYVEDPDADPQERAQVLLALSEMNDLAALEPLLFATERLSADQRSQTFALYGVGEVFKYYAPDNREALPPVVDEASETLVRVLPKLSKVNQCVAVDALQKMADARTAPALQALFESDESTFECPTAEEREHDGRVKTLSTSDPIRIKILRVVARLVVGDDEVLRWLEREAASDAYSDEINRELDNVLSLAQARQE